MHARSGDRPPLPPGFGVLWTTVAIDLVGFGMVLPLLPRYARDLGASPATTGLLVASFSLAQLVMAPVMGRVSDRVGRKPVLLVSLFGTAVGSALTGLAGSVWLLFVGRILDGASGASVSVAQAAAADLAAPHDRPRLMGLLGAAFGVGFVAGPALGGLGALGGPKVPFLLAATIATVNGLVAIRRLPETNPSVVGVAAAATDAERIAALPALAGAGLAEPAHLPSVGPRLDDRSALVRLVAGAACAVAAFAAFESTFSLLLEDRFGLSLAATSALFAVVGIELVVVQGVLVGRASTRFGPMRTVLGGLALNAVGLAVLAPDWGWAGLVPALALLALGQGLVTPTLSSLLAGRAGSQRGRWLGWQQSAGAGARVVGPVAAGVLFGRVGPSAPPLVAVAVTLVAFVVLAAERHGVGAAGDRS